MSSLDDQIEAELAARAEQGFTESFSNGGHSVTRTPLRDLVAARALLRQAEAGQGGGRLADFDPNL